MQPIKALVPALTAGLASMLVGVWNSAQAGEPCDSRVKIGPCHAGAKIEGEFVRISTDRTCSMVTWIMDGIRRTTTIVDGEERLQLLTVSAPDKVEVESCIEIKDLRREPEQSSNARPGSPGDPDSYDFLQEASEAARTVRRTNADYEAARSAAMFAAAREQIRQQESAEAASQNLAEQAESVEEIETGSDPSSDEAFHRPAEREKVPAPSGEGNCRGSAPPGLGECK